MGATQSSIWSDYESWGLNKRTTADKAVDGSFKNINVADGSVAAMHTPEGTTRPEWWQV